MSADCVHYVCLRYFPYPLWKKIGQQIGSEVKKLHADARKQGICGRPFNWRPTLKQILQIKRGYPYLGRSTLVGSPLFAFPENILNHWDMGEDVWAVSNRRLYFIKDDGRPYRLSVPIPINRAQCA